MCVFSTAGVSNQVVEDDAAPLQRRPTCTRTRTCACTVTSELEGCWPDRRRASRICEPLETLTTVHIIGAESTTLSGQLCVERIQQALQKWLVVEPGLCSFCVGRCWHKQLVANFTLVLRVNWERKAQIMLDAGCLILTNVCWRSSLNDGTLPLMPLTRPMVHTMRRPRHRRHSTF